MLVLDLWITQVSFFPELTIPNNFSLHIFLVELKKVKNPKGLKQLLMLILQFWCLKFSISTVDIKINFHAFSKWFNQFANIKDTTLKKKNEK